jgi:peptidoglycan/LPS O-acetylase OafA/YrhL
MDNDDAGRRLRHGGAALGGLLLLLGILVLASQALSLEMGEAGWPFFVIVPGLGLLGLGRWLVGVARGRRELAASGGWLIAAGLVAFLGLAVVLEAVVGIGGRTPEMGGRYGLAALLIVAGLVLVGRWLLAPGGRDVSGRLHRRAGTRR